MTGLTLFWNEAGIAFSALYLTNSQAPIQTKGACANHREEFIDLIDENCLCFIQVRGRMETCLGYTRPVSPLFLVNMQTRVFHSQSPLHFYTDNSPPLQLTEWFEIYYWSANDKDLVYFQVDSVHTETEYAVDSVCLTAPLISLFGNPFFNSPPLCS